MPPRLMIIESDSRARRRLVSALSRGWPRARLLACPADDRAVGRARHWRPDVIVADWDEHADNAVELSRALNCAPELARTRVAALATEIPGPGCEEILVVHKPAGAREVRAAVESLLRSLAIPS